MWSERRQSVGACHFPGLKALVGRRATGSLLGAPHHIACESWFVPPSEEGEAERLMLRAGTCWKRTLILSASMSISQQQQCTPQIALHTRSRRPARRLAYTSIVSQLKNCTL